RARKSNECRGAPGAGERARPGPGVRAVADADARRARRAPRREEARLLLTRGEILVARAAPVPPQKIPSAVLTLHVDAAARLMSHAPSEPPIGDLQERSRGAVVSVERRRHGLTLVRRPVVEEEQDPGIGHGARADGTRWRRGCDRSLARNDRRHTRAGSW